MIPYYMLVIEDESDRAFVEGLFINNNRLMFSEIRKIASDPWIADNVMQITLVKLIDKVALL